MVAGTEGDTNLEKIEIPPDHEPPPSSVAGTEGDTDWEKIKFPPDHLWDRAVEYLLRLAKLKRHWAFGGTVLKQLKEKSKKINEEIDAELRMKAEMSKKINE